MTSAPAALLQTAIGDRYTIDRVIGEGGMATVYLAEDRKHHRLVALKLLKTELGALLGAERFLAEIQVTATLQHPHLLPLFDSGEADGMLYYVMPFVEGESLRARLDRERQLPVDEALRISIAIAGALDYAHRHGVIHRDLKPENILLQDGQPLVADFGIALAVSRAGGERVTQTGMSVGTPQYMSPEQAAADRVVDGRSDIYALAAMLYEMLTGDPPHAGSTVQAVIARVLTETPRPARSMRASVPEFVEAALERAMAKVPADRFNTARDFAAALSIGEPGSGQSVSGARLAFASAGGARARGRLLRDPRWLALGVVALVGCGTAAWLALHPAASGDQRVARFLMKPLSTDAGPAVITSDGRTLVYLGTSEGRRMVFVRGIDDFSTRALAGTEDATRVFLSSDGKWIGYFSTDDKIKKVPVEGGASTIVAPGFQLGGASWGSNDVIVSDFSRIDGLSWVRASGGETHRLTHQDASRRESRHSDPLVLPDGKAVIFLARTEGRALSAVGELALVPFDAAATEPAPHVLLGIRSRGAVAVVDGWLLYAGEERATLMAVRLDEPGRSVVGLAVQVLQDVSGGVQEVSVSRNGTLIYERQTANGHEPKLVDIHGVAQPLTGIGSNRSYMNPRLSPEGNRLAIQGTSPQGNDIWIFDLATRTPTRLTTTGSALSPAWSRDGKRIIFISTTTGRTEVQSQPADGSAPAEKLFGSEGVILGETVTPDGATLVFQRKVNSVWGLWSAALTGDHAIRPLVDERNDNYMPTISPDGAQLAYVSNSTGSHEIYVRPYPGPGSPVQVSEHGGTEPRWSRDGRQLFYRSGNELLAATIASTSPLAVTGHVSLFKRTFDGEMPHANFDPSADGNGFVMIGAADGVDREMAVVVNWLTELRARLAANDAH